MRSSLTRLRFISLAGALLAFAMALFSGCASGTASQTVPDKGRAAQEQPACQVHAQTQEPAVSPSQSQIRTVQATVTSASDGDTVHVSLDGRDERVRMISVNCPEISHPNLGIKEEPYGRKAKAYTERQLTGKKVWLEFDVQERDSYGRLLAYVWLEPPGSGSEDEVRTKMFNARLLLDGYAQVMTVPPNVKYADMFVEFQRKAREQGKGLWGAVPAPVVGGGTQKNSNGTHCIGNAGSKVFHLPTCEWAQKVAPQNRVEFRSREEALRAGYRPCKVCRP